MTYLATLVIALLLAVPALAQRGPSTTPVDPELEQMADHNLEIADFYFSKKKAYAGAKDRLLEVVMLYPEYTKIDRVYFLLAEVYAKTGEEAKARETFELLLETRPQSELAERARRRLAELPLEPAPQTDGTGGGSH